MKCKSTKHFSTLLALVMLLGLLAAMPLTAFAAVQAAPTDLKWQDSTTSSITIRWTDNSSNEFSFIISRKEGSGAWDDGFNNVVANVTEFTDNAAQGGKIYTYRVRATIIESYSPLRFKASDWSNEIQAITKPEAPGNLTATADAGGIILNWTHNSTNTGGFTIERKEGANPPSDIGNVAAGFRTYTDSTAQAGTTYTYSVVADSIWVGGAAIYSDPSNEATATVYSATTAPSITGPTTMSLAAGYAATATDVYTIGGIPAPTVTKTSGNAAITWNNGTKKLDIAAGLAAGSYPVVLTATRGSHSGSITFTLTVTDAATAPTITGPTTMTLAAGYAATSTGAYTVGGAPAPTVTKTSGNAAITWNDATKKLDIAAGLAAGSYPVVLTASNGTYSATLTFTLTVSMAAVAPPPTTGTGTGSMGNFLQMNTYRPGQFTDVDENLWYGFYQQKSVATAFEYGLMKGSSDTIFNPTGNMTLAEAITVAARVHSIYKTGAESFTQGSPWYQVYVDYAVANGIIETGVFTNYTRAATRAEMAYIFSRALNASELLPKNTVISLPDVKSGFSSATGQPLTPYYNSIIILYEAGVVAGDASGAFYPNNNINRAEAAAIISRVILPNMRFSGKTYNS